MRAENLETQPLDSRKYLQKVLVVFGVIAFSASAYVAWPALVHIGAKLI